VPAALEATLLVGIAIVYVELILGELVPKALALRFTDTVAVMVAWPLDILARFSKVVIAFLTASTRAVLFLFRIKDIGHRTFVSEEEIKHLVKEGREQGVLDQTEEELIHSVFEFSETPVKKVMVPRPKIFALDVSTPPEEVGRLMVESGFSRIPVYDGSPDNMVGVVYIKDALRLLEKHQPVVLRKILHPVHFVPESKKVGELLKELQKRRTHLASVIDEHGSSSASSPSRTCSRRSWARSRTNTTGKSGRSRRCATDRWWWTAPFPRPSCARPTTSRSPSPRTSTPWPASCSTAWARCRAGARWSEWSGGLPPDRRGRREEPHLEGQDRQGAAAVR
jgi:CBS domain-containing protein